MIKSVIKSIIFILIFCFIVSGITLAKTGEIKNSDFLNLREKATTDSAILVKMPADAKFEILDDSDYWFRIKYKEYTGYVNGEYVKISSSTQSQPTQETEPTTPEPQEQVVQESQTTTQNPSNNPKSKGKLAKASDVYSLPLINSIKLGSLSINNEVDVISITEKWIYVQNSSISGWIFKDNIKIEE